MSFACLHKCPALATLSRTPAVLARLVSMSYPALTPQCVGAKASHNAATLKQDVSAIPSTKQSVDMESSSVLELDQPAPELHIASQPVYASRFKKKKVGSHKLQGLHPALFQSTGPQSASSNLECLPSNICAAQIMLKIH
eukprot:scaffold181430_cov22-Tisochrysis_lutea.AAC.1